MAQNMAASNFNVSFIIDHIVFIMRLSSSFFRYEQLELFLTFSISIELETEQDSPSFHKRVNVCLDEPNIKISKEVLATFYVDTYNRNQTQSVFMKFHFCLRLLVCGYS